MAGEPENQRIARLTPLADVLARIDALVAPVAPRMVALSGALGRVLAENIAAEAAQPADARALLDGYAVRAEEIADASSYTPAPLGSAPVRVDAGDRLPSDTDAVVLLDTIVSRGAAFEAVAPAVAGDGVLPAHADLEIGAVIAHNGWRLNRFNIAMLATAGVAKLPVREPRIGLVEAHARPDTVFEAVGDLLAGALGTLGCEVARQAGNLAGVLMDEGCDAIIGIGGTGTGRNDASVSTLAAHGRVEAHGIAITPGETAAFGMCGQRPVLLLPGRIDAAIAGWLTVGLPLIERLSGSSDAGASQTKAQLTRKVASPLGVVEIVPVRLTKDGAEPIASDYWRLGPLAGSDGWIMVPADSEGFPAQREVVVRPWP